MDVTPLVPPGRQMVEAYGNGGFRIAGVAWRGPVILFPDRCLAWPGGGAGGLSMEALAPVFETDEAPEILLLGLGASAVLVPAALRAAIRAEGTVVDAMNTGAACRTWNVLMAEGRRAAAALAPVA